MKNTFATLCLLSGLLISSACDHAHARGAKSKNEKSVTINRTWPAADIEHLRIFEIDGSIDIEAADTKDVTLVAVATGSNLQLKPDKENQGLFETRLDGDTLRIGRKEDDRRKKFRISMLWGRDRMRIAYTLKVPREMELDMTTVNGKIATRGIDGETEATTVNGSIDVEVTGAHELEAESVNGRVKAKFLTSFQGAKFSTVNGGVEAILPQNASFSVDLAQVNGDFEASFPLSINSNPGRRRVSGEVNGGQHELKITTVNGDVELARLGEPR
jgi:hypothetical protein